MTLAVGMLWYDDNPNRALAEKLATASEHYLAKYGVRPDVCYLHTSSADHTSEDRHGLKLILAPDILPNHFWLGVMA